jgi:periplasmic protein TonB
MTRDFIVGILVSAALHAGMYWGPEYFKKEVKKEVKKEEKTVIQVIELPPVEPDEPVVVDDAPATPQEVVIAPPSMADIVGVVQVDSFVQQIQPPPPPNIGAPSNALTIPPGRPVAGNIGRSIDTIFDVKDLDQKPTERVRVSPNYPYEMRRNGISGRVILGIVSDANGNVIDAYVINSTHREFEEPARIAVMKWKFRPGKKGGRNVASRMELPMEFNAPNE